MPLAKRFRPDAITLDIGLPDMDGLALLDLLKRNPRDAAHPGARHLGGRRRPARAAASAPIGFSGKPVERDDHPGSLDRREDVRGTARRSACWSSSSDDVGAEGGGRLIGGDDVEIERASQRVGRRWTLLRRATFDCVVVDCFGQPRSAAELIEWMRGEGASHAAAAGRLRARRGEERNAGDIALGAGRARGRAHAATAQRAHGRSGVVPAPAGRRTCPRTGAQMPAAAPPEASPSLPGRKVLVIDDDIRNIFSLTSALEEHGVELLYAESGRAGIEILQQHAGRRRRRWSTS